MQTLLAPNVIHKKRGSDRQSRFEQIYSTAGVARTDLQRLTATFSRFASTHQTAFDGTAVSVSTNASGNQMERQVHRALTQVLGRAPGRGNGSFTHALNDAFPVVKYGQVTMQPTRNAVSLVSSGIGATETLSSSQLSTSQATLHRQARLISEDMLRILPTIDAFSPRADGDEIAALKSLIEIQVRALVDEFGRIDRPRFNRVESLFNSLLGVEAIPNVAPAIPGSLGQLGETALLNCNTTRPTTIQDEGQLANYYLVRSYGDQLKAIWQSYWNTLQSSDTCAEFSARLERSNILLPVVAEANNEFIGALDAIGFGEYDRLSLAANFRLLKSKKAVASDPLFVEPPDLTVRGFNEWIDRFTTIEAPVALADSGQYGLDFVAEQADVLFTVIYSIMLPIKQDQAGGTLLERALKHERVTWALEDIFFQIKELADVADGSVY